MVTLEIHGQFVTWPEDFALTMMRYYRNHGVPFTVHRNSVHPGGNTTGEHSRQKESKKNMPTAAHENMNGVIFSPL